MQLQVNGLVANESMSNSGWKFTIHNDKYKAVLTGQLIRIYDKDTNNEIARFKDLEYAYRAVFNPTKNMLAVKSTQPWLAFYNLDTMTLIQKFKCKKVDGYAQDSGFCFSANGRHFLNIEGRSLLIDKKNVYSTALAVYDTESFEEIERFFENPQYWFWVIERHNSGYLLAGSEQNVGNIVAFFNGREISKKRIINVPEFMGKTSAYNEVYYQD